ncbi:hypothetical protein VSH64_44935 [Amycolatopsis rhabdoformis]|uniref:Lactonase family protein n=1 Tax=Amycolatopsis rhabdoformis TaxID=1448059 RepID=A0ABZ1I635_9PSEU|nr:hypothetical protein [Amycolatopsis rhabdoformis]WSE29863.1 hypothetical protein VSH64_44935 [Amycolatopsis rhabdoformis]
MPLHSLSLLLGLALTAAATPAEAAPAPPPDFQGRALVVISDADQVPSAYVDGLLGPREGHDALSTIALATGRTHHTEVSNSVAGAPAALAVSPDGHYAFVAETFGQAGPAATRSSDLAPGTTLSLVDLTAPRIVQQVQVGKRLETADLDPAGDLLAVGLNPADGRGVAFVPFHDGRLGTPTYAQLPGVAPGTRICDVTWHPSGEFLGATLCDAGQVVFARVQRQAGAVTLQPWGPQPAVGKYPFKLVWARDGHHALVNNLQWGPDVEGFWTEAPQGEVASVRFDESPAQHHEVVDRAPTGVSPEGLVLGPDGRSVVTTNLERSYVPAGDPRKTWYSSLSLLTFDPGTGRLGHAGEFPFDGVLPESAVFDASGRYLAVTDFDHFDDRVPGGSVDFWRVTADPLDSRPVLVRTGASIPVQRGPHTIVLVP